MFNYTYFVAFVYATTTGPAFHNLSVDLPQRLDNLDAVQSVERSLARMGYAKPCVLGFTLFGKTAVTP